MSQKSSLPPRASQRSSASVSKLGAMDVLKKIFPSPNWANCSSFMRMTFFVRQVKIASQSARSSGSSIQR